MRIKARPTKAASPPHTEGWDLEIPRLDDVAAFEDAVARAVSKATERLTKTVKKRVAQEADRFLNDVAKSEVWVTPTIRDGVLWLQFEMEWAPGIASGPRWSVPFDDLIDVTEQDMRDNAEDGIRRAERLLETIHVYTVTLARAIDAHKAAGTTAPVLP